MKKKSFFSGYTAKIAMVAVALSSAVLTGCYKDEGLDVSTPAGSITFPEATYMLNVSVVDETGAPVPNAVITVNGASQPMGSSCSVSVQPGSVAIDATATGYTSAGPKTITIASLANGQSAVYTETIVLTKTTYQQTYNMNITVMNADLVELAEGTDYSMTVVYEDGSTVENFNNVRAGQYTIRVNSTNAAYESTTVTWDLPAVVTTSQEPVAANKLIILNEVEAPVQYQMLYGEVVGFPAGYENRGLTIMQGDNVVVRGDYSVQYQVVRGEESNYSLVFTYADENGQETTITRLFGTYTSYTLSFGENAAPEEGVNVVEGTVAEDTEISVGGGDALLVSAGTTITTSSNEPFTGTLTVTRDRAEEESTPVATRVYNGTPSGLTFSTPLQLSYTDIWGGELGDMELAYLNNGVWTAESTIAAGDPYVMNVAHFSSFRAQVAADVTPVTTEMSEETVTPVDKYNDSDNEINVTCNYTYLDGTIISDVQAAVAAQFTNSAAVAFVTEVINARLAADGYVAQAVTTVEASQQFVVYAHSVLNTVKKTQYRNEVTYTFVINEKTITINVVDYTRAVIDGTDQSSYSHGHGHGHGGDLNSGGGIVEAE